MAAADSQEDVTNEEINVRIKTINDENFNLRVAPNLLVAELKERIKVVSDISEDRQRLIYRGQVLKDADTLTSSRVEDGTTVHLVSRPQSHQISSGGASESAESVEPAASRQHSLLDGLLGQSGTGTAPRTEGTVDDAASTAARLMLMSTLTGGASVPFRLGSEAPTTLLSNGAGVSPARDGPHVPNPGSLEHVRQGLLTMHTILAANPQLDHREVTAAADVVTAAAEAAASRLAAERDVLAQAAADAEAAAEAAATETKPLAPGTQMSVTTSDGATSPVAVHDMSRDGLGPCRSEELNDSFADEFFDSNSSFVEEPERSDHGSEGPPFVNGHHPAALPSLLTPLRGTATSNNWVQGRRRSGVPHFFIGQWVDCKDTVNQWLESTVMEISTRPASELAERPSSSRALRGGGGGGNGSTAPSFSSSTAAQQRRLATLRAAQRATRQLQRANARLAAATAALGAASSAVAASGAAEDGGDRSARSAATSSILRALEALGGEGSGSSAPPGERGSTSSSETEDDEEEGECADKAEEDEDTVLVPCLLIHYNGWPSRWDEWLPFDSPRIAPFRTRTSHPIGTPAAHTFISPSPLARVAAAPWTGDDDVRVVLPEVSGMLEQEFTPLLQGLQRLCEEQMELEQWQQAKRREEVSSVGDDEFGGGDDAEEQADSDDAADTLADLDQMSVGEGEEAHEPSDEDDQQVTVDEDPSTEPVFSSPLTSPERLSSSRRTQAPSPSPSSAADGRDSSGASGGREPPPPLSTRPSPTVSLTPSIPVATTQSGEAPPSRLPWTSSHLLDEGRLRPLAHLSGASSATPPPRRSADERPLDGGAPVGLAWGSSVGSEEKNREEFGDDAAGPFVPSWTPPPTLPTELPYSRIEGLQSSEVARRERIREVAAGLAPLADRLGRLIADLAPHLATLAENGGHLPSTTAPETSTTTVPETGVATAFGGSGAGAAEETESRGAAADDEEDEGSEDDAFSSAAAAAMAALQRDRATHLRQQRGLHTRVANTTSTFSTLAAPQSSSLDAASMPASTSSSPLPSHQSSSPPRTPLLLGQGPAATRLEAARGSGERGQTSENSSREDSSVGGGQTTSAESERPASPLHSYRQLISSASSPPSGSGGSGNIDIHIHAIVTPMRTTPTPPSPAPASTTPPPAQPSPPSSDVPSTELLETQDDNHPHSSTENSNDSQTAAEAEPRMRSDAPSHESSAPPGDEGTQAETPLIASSPIDLSADGADSSAPHPRLSPSSLGAAAAVDAPNAIQVPSNEADNSEPTVASSASPTPSISTSLGSLTGMIRRMSALSRGSSSGSRASETGGGGGRGR